MATVYHCDRCGVESKDTTGWLLTSQSPYVSEISKILPEDVCKSCLESIRLFAKTRPVTSERALLQLALTSIGVDKKLRAEAAYTAFQTHLHGNNFLMALPWDSSLNQAAWFAVIDGIDEIVHKAIHDEQAAKAQVT